MNLPPTTTTSTSTSCSNCGFNNRWFIHRVHLRGTDRRLCTSCVLRLHPSSFCPSCLEFFEHPLSTASSAHRFLSCVKCSSLTHLHCLPSPPPPPSSFLCPPCSQPTFSFFHIDKTTPLLLDKRLSLVLLCAAKIASASVSKALSSARAKADRSVREAAVARKRAKEALEHLEMAKRVVVEGSLSGSRNLGIHKVMTRNADNKNGFRGNGNADNKSANDGKLEIVQSSHGR